MNEDQRIGQLLIREKAISEEDLKRGLEAQESSYGKPLGEVLIELNIISETEFLRVLAKKFHTQYLTTKKLSELRVPEAVLKLVPENTAEKYKLFPVQYRKAEKSLTIVMANPDDVGAVDEVKFVSGIGNIKALIALKDSVEAAFNKWYKDDENSFDMLLGFGDGGGYDFEGASSSPPSNAPAKLLEDSDSPLDLSAIVASSEDDENPSVPDPEESNIVSEEELFLGGLEELPGDNNLAREDVIVEEISVDEEDEVEEVEVKPTRQRTDVKKYRLRMLVLENHDSIRKFIVKLFSHEGFKVRGVSNQEEALQELERGEYDSLVIKDRDLGEGEEFANKVFEKFPDVELCSIKDYGSALIGETRAQKRLMSSFLETLDVLMSMLEMEIGDLKGHSHNTAKYSKLIASKLDLPQREVDTIAMAAYIHELGLKGVKHRSLMNIDDDDADPEDILEQSEIPVKLLSAAKIPLDVKPILRSQFEKWNGKGLPEQLVGEDIPIGARILSLVEAFEDLTNKFSGDSAIEPTAALEVLKKHENEFFDPALVELFLGIVRDDIYIQQMAGDLERILIADTEADFVTLLELKLANMGFAVTRVRSAQEAIEKAKSDQPTLIISEAALPDMSGFEMIEQIKAQPENEQTAFLFLSKNDDSESVNRGFGLGAEDYITKPIKVDILCAKIKTMMGRITAEKEKTRPAASGVSGSLSEMGIPDIVQILNAGRKTGRITLEDNGNTCHIDMQEGQVVNASIDDLKGEDAFYQILYWTKGNFSIDSSVEISEVLINMSMDSLMLEGFKRMDEGGKEGAVEDDIALDGSDFF